MIGIFINGCATFKQFLWINIVNLVRVSYGVGILTVYCRLNYHLYKIGFSESLNCVRCGEIESSIHFLAECPILIRSKLFILDLSKYSIRQQIISMGLVGFWDDYTTLQELTLTHPRLFIHPKYS